MNETFLTVPEVAKLLKVSKSYIYDLINQGRMDYFRMSERRTRIPAKALEEIQVQNMNNLGYNRVVQPPKRGRKPNGSN